MESFAEELMEELTAETVFTIPVFGGIAVAESVVVTWVIMAVFMLLILLLTRNLQVHNISKRQAALETFVTFIQNLTSDFVGEHGACYVPYLSTIIIYIGFANIVGIFGFKPPTKDLNVTAALAIMSIVLIESAAIRAKGGKGFIKPTPVMIPINIMETATRPLSLCMRLFGNILGAFTIMKLVELFIPAVAPAICSLYFDFFDGFIQAYIFVFLTGLFIREAIE